MNVKQLSRYAEFVTLIARLTKPTEIQGGMSLEDAWDTLQRMISDARVLSGIKPGYPEFCPECLERPLVPEIGLCHQCCTTSRQLKLEDREET